jgi:hypothetical protein
MLSDTSTVSTTSERSFAGLALAHLAATLVVCGGLVLLVPAPALAQGARAAIAPITVLECADSGRPAGDHQLSRTAELSSPASNDDDHAPTGSDTAIAVDQCRMITRGDVMHVVQIEAEPWISHTVDGHSLRGPPADDDTSDDDFDGDDNDPTAELAVPLPPPTAGESCPVTPVQFTRLSSVRSSGSSLRAPPV